jgi:alpha-glucosidase (family GH31 glycosyl hydrolase)
MKKSLFKILLISLMSVFFVFSTAMFVSCSKKIQNNDNEGGGDKIQTDKLSEIIINNNIRIQLLSETLVRIEQKGEKDFEDRASYIVSNRDGWKSVSYTKTIANGNVVINTSKYSVSVPENAQDVSGIIINDVEGESIWTDKGLTTTNVYLPSPSDALKSWYFTDSPRIIPSEYGYSVTDNSDVELQGWDFKNDSPDYFVFLSDGDYKQFCQDYTDLTGKSEMVSLQMQGFWDSRWYAYSSETALQQIKDYQDKGFPIDILVIDTDWRKSSSTGIGYEINDNLFPDMADFLSKCEEMGVNITFNDHPEPVSGTDNGLDSDEVDYRNNNLTLMLSLGLDYWWYDRNWSVSLNSASPDISVYAFGMYAYQWITNEYLESITDLDSYAERALIMGNVDGCLNGKWTYASNISAHRYSIQWTGDIGADRNALEQEIYSAIFGGAEVGIPYMSSDIGGHTSAVTDDMYARWIQYGALSAITRVHCTNVSYIGQEGRMPWLFGEQSEDIAKEYIEMRYRLLPLYYQLARENYDTGLPILRRLDIEYPQYEESSRNDEYLLGDSVLVAPISEAETATIVPSSWLSFNENGVLKQGLEGQYYKTSNWTGSYELKTDNCINFDWETGGPSQTGMDNFSILWSGKITIGDKDSALQLYADDGIVVMIDGVKVIDGIAVYDKLLTTPYYAANSVHNIEVKYCEYGGNAHVYMYYTEKVEDGHVQYNTRTVFIPDGIWIDVWSDAVYIGPATITVKHPLATSPIFVKEGTILALADNMINTSEKDWSNISLDVYPSLTQSAERIIYEDDTYTQAYKDKQYRTTRIVSSFVESINSQLITVYAAEGSFSGAKAFTSRDFTVRLHIRESFGSVKNITVNGIDVAFDYYDIDNNASPFACTGGARDSEIYEFIFTSDLSKNYEIKVFFEDILDVSQKIMFYDKTSIDFDLSAGESDTDLNITESGNYDWAAFGINSADNIVRKANANTLIGTPVSYDTSTLYTSSPLFIEWTDGDILESSSNICGIESLKNFDMTLKTDGKQEYFVIYAAGYKCTAKMSVRDRAGNVKTVYFGNLNGDFIKRVVINCKEAKTSELYVTYAMCSCVPNGVNSQSQLGLIAAYVTDNLKDPTINNSNVNINLFNTQNDVDSANLSTANDLSDVHNTDWMQFGWFSNTNVVSKKDGNIITGVSFTDGRAFYDYGTLISWSDGDKIENEMGIRYGTCTSGTISINLNLPAGLNYIQLYTGAWNSENTVYVYDILGGLLASTETFSAEATSKKQLVTFKCQGDERSRIIIKIVSTNASNSGNVSLMAVSVLGEGEEETPNIPDISAILYDTAENVQTADLSTESKISDVENLDWMHFGWFENTSVVSKKDADIISVINFLEGRAFYDYNTLISWNDGDKIENETGTRYGTCTPGSITIMFNLKAGTNYIHLFTGAWNSENTVCVYNEKLEFLASSVTFSADNTAKAKLITFKTECDEPSNLIIKIKSTNASDGGNVSLAAVSVSS